MAASVTRNCPIPSIKRAVHFSQIFVKIDDVRFSDTVKEAVTGVTTLKAVLFTLLHNMFRRLPINGRDMNIRASEINVGLTKSQRKRGL
jgi:hypothetical protein